MMILHNKLPRLARALRQWSRKKIGNVTLLSAIAHQLILGLDQAQDHRKLTLAEIGLRQHLKTKLLGLASGNAREYFGCMPVTQTLNSSTSKQTDAVAETSSPYCKQMTAKSQLTTMADKHKELHRHFSATIGTPKTRQCSLNWNLLDLPRLDLSSLDEQFSEVEIKKADFALPSGKAPGPENGVDIAVEIINCSRAQQKATTPISHPAPFITNALRRHQHRSESMAAAEENGNGLEFLTDPVDRYVCYFVFVQAVALNLSRAPTDGSPGLLTDSPGRILKPTT